MNKDNTFYYWINLDNRQDRRKHMLKEFENCNITNHIRISPVNHYDNQISVILSHMKAILTAYIDKADYAVILEDDIILDNIFILKDITKRLPDDWDIFQFHTLEPHIYKELSKDIKYENQIIKGHLMSCAGYIMNKYSINKYVKKFIHIISKKHITFEPRISDYKNFIAEACIYVFMNTYYTLYPLFNTIISESSIKIKNEDNNTINSKLVNIIHQKHKHIFLINFSNIFDTGLLQIGRAHV